MKNSRAGLPWLALTSLLVGPSAIAAGAAPTPTPLLARAGKPILREDFSRSLVPATGDTARFPSGYAGWRFNIEPRAGHWEQAGGVFTGAENAAHKHPATASYGFKFTNAVVRFDVRMNDAPWEGRAWRYFHLRITDDKGYLCGFTLGPDDWRIQKDDTDRGGPDTGMSFGKLARTTKPGEWTTVVLELFGEEFAVTIDGRTLTGRHPLLAKEKHSIMFVSGLENSVRNLGIWTARRNPAWPKLRTALRTDDVLAEPETVELSHETIDDRSKEGVRDRFISNIGSPAMTISMARSAPTGHAVLIIPGGDPAPAVPGSPPSLAIDREGHHVARWLNSIGVVGVVLKHRLPASETAAIPALAREDAALALRRLRSDATRLGIKPAAIGVLGFGRGALVAAQLSAPGPNARAPADAPAFTVLVDPLPSKAAAPGASAPRTLLIRTSATPDWRTSVAAWLSRD